jgi:hypothetical protein
MGIPLYPAAYNAPVLSGGRPAADAREVVSLSSGQPPMAKRNGGGQLAAPVSARVVGRYATPIVGGAVSRTIE